MIIGPQGELARNRFRSGIVVALKRHERREGRVDTELVRQLPHEARQIQGQLIDLKRAPPQQRVAVSDGVRQSIHSEPDHAARARIGRQILVLEAKLEFTKG